MTSPHFQGGRFTWQRTVEQVFRLMRDEMIAPSLLTADLLGFGLAGSDAVRENPNSRIVETELMPIVSSAGQKLRFALATINDGRRVKSVRSKMATGEPLRVGTSYPNTAVRVLGALGVKVALSAKFIQPGGIELLLRRYPEQLDAIFELVQSGDSIVDNGLTIVEDNITPVTLLRVLKIKPVAGTL